MALNSYITQVRSLLHDPNAQFYSDSTLTGFINEARQQVALEGECIRGIGTTTTVLNQQLYQNSIVVVPTVPVGIASPGLVVPRSISFNPGIINSRATITLEGRGWDWFNFYWLGIAAPPAGRPAAWSPFQIGANGSFYIGPAPNQLTPLSIDGIWLPLALTDDSIAEAIPYPWTDAIKFYATFLAYMDSQRSSDAQEMFNEYENFMKRARGIVTPLRSFRTFPGNLSSRSIPGQAPPTPANDRGNG